MFSRKEPLREAWLKVAGQRVAITEWHERRDLVALFPQYSHIAKCGFWVQFKRPARHRFALLGVTESGRRLRSWVRTAGREPDIPSKIPDAENLVNRFIRQVNEHHLSVLEIGSRIVSPGSVSKRTWFPDASSYTGVDYYGDGNTDVVGDAHTLARHVGENRFDAVFSVATLEHLAMPWVVAMEINKVLKTGGITFHQTPFAWPSHDRPWDFYRYSDLGLRSLFSPALGYEVIEAGMFEPLRMHFDRQVSGQEGFPMEPGFAGAAILARKIADVDKERFRWETSRSEVLGDASHYPPQELLQRTSDATRALVEL
jgi:SAM-dependent methyltransferase